MPYLYKKTEVEILFTIAGTFTIHYYLSNPSSTKIILVLFSIYWIIEIVRGFDYEKKMVMRHYDRMHSHVW